MTTRRLLISVMSIVILLSVTSCVYPIAMKVTGKADQSITFTFFKSANDETPSTFEVVGFTVQELSNESKWVAIWHLNGKRSLSSIVYAQKYDGLNEVVPAKPLFPNRRYRAIASGTTWAFSGMGHAEVDFFFDEGGNVTRNP